METGIKVFFDILLYLFLLLLLRRTLSYKAIRRQELLIGIAIMFILCLFPLWSGDYSHYAEDYLDLLKGQTTNIEPVYVFVAKHLSFSYYTFRMILWGGSFLAVCYLYKRLKLRESLALFIFASTSIVMFAYARASIAMTFLFVGFSLVVYPINKKILSYLIGIAMMGASYYFHQSAIYGIIMCLFSLFAYSMNKKRLVLLTIIAIAGFFYMRGRIGEFMMINTGGEEALRVIDRAQFYGSADSSRSGMGAIIEMSLARMIFYLSVLHYLIIVFKRKYFLLPKYIQCFATSTFFIIAFANLFLLDWGINTYAFYYRLMNFAIIPMVVYLSYCYMKGISPKLIRAICLTGIISSLYTLFYSFYISFT